MSQIGSLLSDIKDIVILSVGKMSVVTEKVSSIVFIFRDERVLNCIELAPQDPVQDAAYLHTADTEFSVTNSGYLFLK